MSEPQFSYPAFRIACVAAWSELMQAMRKDGHTVNDKSGPNTMAWMENIVRDTFIAQAAGHLTPRRAAAVTLLQTMGYHWDGVTWNAPIPHPTLRDQLQQKCSDWGAYWRASDAHGVDLTPEQAYELLRRALGVEVKIDGVEDSSLPPDMVLVDAGGSAPPIAVSVDGGGNDDLSAAYLLGKYDGRKAATFENHGDSEANFIADGEHLNCPACGGSGHVDDVHPERVTREHWVAIGRAQALAEFTEQRANARRELLAGSQQPAEALAFTTGHCKNHKQPGGCQLHNLQCGYPECDRKPVAKPVPPPAIDIGKLREGIGSVRNHFEYIKRRYAISTQARVACDDGIAEINELAAIIGDST